MTESNLHSRQRSHELSKRFYQSAEAESGSMGEENQRTNILMVAGSI
jgi:hypothetical protein